LGSDEGRATEVNVRQHKAFVSFLLLPLGLQIFGSVEARAVPDGTCGVGEFCLWMDANQQGCFWHGAVTNEDFRKVRYTTCPDRSLNDSVSSYKNDRGSDWYVLYDNPQYKGAAYCLGPKASGNVDPGFNDKASSSFIYPSEQMTPEARRKGCRWVDPGRG
jgi:hypothetical protein